MAEKYETVNDIIAERDRLRADFAALQHAIVGATGASAILVADTLRRDAERYRWLREQHWSSAELCVVMDPKDAVKLGRTCPSREYLDVAIDDAMLIGRAVGAA